MIDIDESITLEDRLCKLADSINETIGKNNNNTSACSIYLYDNRRDKYVLRASTEETRYLGKDELNTGETIKKKFENNQIDGFGITVLAVLEKKTIISKHGDICEDSRFGRYQFTPEQRKKWEVEHFCEYKLENVGAVISSPIIFKEDDPVGGVVRVVRFKSKTTEFCSYFNEQDISKLESLINENLAWIQSGAFISQLIELGTYMDVSYLCAKAAEVFKNLLNCKGCSIFLLDENDSTEIKKNYKCYGTTGLVKRINDDKLIDIDDPLFNKEAWYEYEPKTLKEKKPTIPLTVGVVRARTSAFLNNIYESSEIEKQFSNGFKINREKGIGKVCEKFTTTDGRYLESESILFAPMFFCDPTNEHVDVLGVVRVVRPKENGHNPFTINQIHLFVSLVERLSKAVMNAKLIHFFDDLSKINGQNELIEYVVSNIPKYIGAKECAILLLKGNKLIKWASWHNGVTELGNNHNYYDLTDKNEKGYTFYVAKHNQTLMFNGKEDFKKQFKAFSKPPVHKPESGEDPYRFLGIPINDTSGKLIAVIRICKDENATRLTNEDKRMLERIANSLKSRIELFKQEEERSIELDKKLPKELQNQILRLKQIKCKDRLRSFINANRTIESIETSIMDFVPKLWEFYKPTFGGRSLTALKRFELFNAKILNEIPYYRDHFIHQFVVFLIGVCILDKLNYLEIYKDSYSIQNGDFYKEDVEASWFLTSLFHDVAYPLETANKWFWNILDVFIADSANKRNTSIPVDSILFNPDYIESIDHLSKFHVNTLKRDEPNIRRTIIQVLTDTSMDYDGLDHGIMGALMLISDKRFELNKILPSSSAIALHNRLCKHKDVDHIKFERHPFAFLLIYCDLLHEWGRTHEQLDQEITICPQLVKFIIADSLEELYSINPTIEKRHFFNETAPCIFTEIRIDKFYENKIEETRSKFNKLKSSTVNFLMKVNRELFTSSSH